MRKEKSCGCIVFNKQYEVLLVKMRQGHWSFPKGHVEGEETEVETATREIMEETNIKVDIDTGFREVSTYSPDTDVTKDVVFFVGEAINKDIVIQEEEIREADFFDVETAKKLITFAADLEIYDKALIYNKNLEI